MVCGNSPIQKGKKLQELVAQNSVITVVNSILNNCCTLHTMPYLCVDGTSVISSIVACECATSGIQGGILLWQPKHIHNWYNVMHCQNKHEHKIDGFCDFCAYSAISVWSISMTAHLKKPELLDIKQRQSVQNWPYYKNLFKMWICWCLQMANNK